MAERVKFASKDGSETSGAFKAGLINGGSGGQLERVTVRASAIVSVQSEKVTFDCAKLDAKLRDAIGHAHDREDS